METASDNEAGKEEIAPPSAATRGWVGRRHAEETVLAAGVGGKVQVTSEELNPVPILGVVEQETVEVVVDVDDVVVAGTPPKAPREETPE